MDKNLLRLIYAGVAFTVITVALLLLFDIHVVGGNEIAVKETWGGGVIDEPYQSKTYFLMPNERMINYPTAVQVFVMNDRKHDDEKGEGRKTDAYLVQSSDSQDMKLSLQVQWRIDPPKVIDFHKKVGKDVDGKPSTERGLRPLIMRAVKDAATIVPAIEAYSGAGLVKLQQDIEKKLLDSKGELSQVGIIVDNFVIEHIALDPGYVTEITARQIAVQRELRAIQEEKAAIAEAKKAKATAQTLYEQEVVSAKTKKDVQILASEAEQQKTVLQAEAEAKKTVVAAQAEKDASQLKADALLAIGKANAESEKLKFSAYSAPGAEVFAKIQVAKSMGESFAGIKGYLPENMTIFTLSDTYTKALESIVGVKKAPAPQP